METIADRIKYAMEKQGIKQSELVSKTGIGKSSISTYLSGDYEPKQKNIYKIAKALDVNESWLMGEDVPMERLNMDEVMRAIRDYNKAVDAAADNLGIGVNVAGTDEKYVLFKAPLHSQELFTEEKSVLISVLQLTLSENTAKMRTLRILTELVKSFDAEDQEKLISYAEYLDSEQQKRRGTLVQRPYQRDE